MSGEKIKIKLYDGDDILPGKIRSKDLAEVITAMEDMVASVISADNDDLNKEEIIVGLSEIGDGCCVLAFMPNFPHFGALQKIIDSITGNALQNLPDLARKSIKKIGDFTKRYKCKADISANNGDETIQATISPITVISEYTKEKPVKNTMIGETTLYGEIKKVGGDAPMILFKPFDENPLSCKTTKELAKEAGALLYSIVGINGIAEWDSDKLQIKVFKILEFTPYRETPTQKAFNGLREIIGDWVDSIEDIESFCNELRYEK
jgi:hypothetical protein